MIFFCADCWPFAQLSCQPLKPHCKAVCDYPSVASSKSLMPLLRLALAYQCSWQWKTEQIVCKLPGPDVQIYPNLSIQSCSWERAPTGQVWIVFVDGFDSWGGCKPGPEADRCGQIGQGAERAQLCMHVVYLNVCVCVVKGQSDRTLFIESSGILNSDTSDCCGWSCAACITGQSHQQIITTNTNVRVKLFCCVTGKWHTVCATIQIFLTSRQMLHLF